MKSAIQATRTCPQRSLRRRWVYAGLAGLAILCPAPAFPEPFDDLRQWIQAQLVRGDVPSLSVAVARDGQILWEEGFGWADRERQVRATPHTRYSLASISKPMTATGLMVLVEEGRVDLDRPVNEYLGHPALRLRVGSAHAATVRRVANHTAGLPLHHHFFIEGRQRPPPMAETIRRYGHIVSAPGERYQYSNLGYGVLAHLIARVASRPYAAFMRDEVFRPLGMLRTSVGIPPTERNDYAIRYGADGTPLPYYDFDHRGASAVFSSAHDLAIFGLFHVGRPPSGTPDILSPSAIRQMQRPTTESRDGFGYGIGWQITQPHDVYRTISHSGGMPGVSTWLTLVPSARLVIVALSNTSTHLPQQVTERLLEALVPFRQRGFARTEGFGGQRRQGRRSPGRRLVGTWAGYVEVDERQIRVGLRVERGGEVFLQLDDQEQKPLRGRHFEGDSLRGVVLGVQLPSRDAGAASHYLQLVLTRRDDRLNGSLTAVAPTGPQIGFALSSWLELRREDGSPHPGHCQVG